ncbi:MAG: cyclic nucleotide-binding domain-containing protein [Myxococcales bacterium]|nr:cyclic nucleotide-binding domain-containing protein [Myxococcales bacterium]
MPTDDLKPFLSGIALFGGLSDAALDRLSQMLVHKEYGKGDTICRQGDTGRSMYVVRSGEVVVCRDMGKGDLVRMVRLGPGEFFGEMTLIDIQPRSATVVVERPALLYSLTNRDLYQLYQQDTEGYVMVLQNICRELSRRLRKADQRISQMAHEQGDEQTQIRAPVRPKSG